MTRCRPSRALVAAVWVAASTLSAAAADDGRPLPEREAFLRAITPQLRADAVVLRRHAYRRTVVERELDGEGRVVDAHTRMWEVRPLPDDPEGFRFVIERDGRPEAPATLARREADYQRRLERARRAMSAQGGERARREALAAETRRAEEEEVADLLRLFEVTLVRRETVESVPCVLASFAPRPSYTPTTRAGDILKSVTGRAWFSEGDHEVVRLDAEAFEPIRYGWGILARVSPGATAHIARRKTADGEWLPARYDFAGRVRVLMVAIVRKDATVTFSDFRPAPQGSAIQ